MAVIDKVISKITSVFSMQTRGAKSTLSAILETRESDRIGSIELYWDMYVGKHWQYSREDGEMPYVNLCKAFVDKSSTWLVGTPPEFFSSKKNQPIMKHVIKELIENSGGPKIFEEIAQMGGVTGDAVVRIGYDPEVNFGKGGVAFKVMDSSRTFWEYKNSGQAQKLSKVLTIWDELREDGGIVTRSQMWTDKEVRNYGYVGGKEGEIEFTNVKEGSTILNDQYGAYYVEKNPYGVVPFVHIQNFAVSQDVHGRSDLKDLWILNKELNSALLAYKDNCDYHGNPLTLLFGISLKEVEKGANKVWGNLPEKARVENLEVTQTFEMLKQYIAYLREFMSMVGGTPEHALGAQRPVSNTSSSALEMEFLPLTEVTRRKRLTYGKGFQQMFEIGISMMDAQYNLGLDALNAPEDDILTDSKDFANDPVFSEILKKMEFLRTRPFYKVDTVFKSSLPKDETIALSNMEAKKRLGLFARVIALKSIGVSDPKSMIKEIDEDRIEEAETAGKIVELTAPPNPYDSSGGGDEEYSETPAEVEVRTNQPAQDVANKRTTKG